jgi:hypothetical protein
VHACVYWGGAMPTGGVILYSILKDDAPRTTRQHTMSVAACFMGWQGRHVRDRGESIRQRMVEPLGADVLLALSYRAEDGCDSVASCGVETWLAGLKPFARVSMVADEPPTALVARMERLPHWPTIVAAFNNPRRRLSCRREGWSAGNAYSPYNCSGSHAGNNIFAPVLGAAVQQLPMLRGVEQCISVIESQEAAIGAAYKRVVYSRLELVWLRPHPPLSVLGEQYAWIPSGEDHSAGVNDRHAVLNRSAAALYLRRWSAIISGDILQIYPHLTGNSEQYLGRTLLHFRVPIRRFAAVAFLDCCSGSCFAGACYKRPMPSPLAIETVRRRLAALIGCGGNLCLSAPSNETTSLAEQQVVAAARFRDSAFAVDDELTFRQHAASAAGPSPAVPGHEANSLDVALATAATRNASAVLVQGKYLPEVAMAVQHAIALSLPGAHYAGGKGRRNFTRKPCRPPFELVGANSSTSCACVLIVAPAVHRRAYRALVLSLQLTAKLTFQMQQSYRPPTYVLWKSAGGGAEQERGHAHAAIGTGE